MARAVLRLALSCDALFVCREKGAFLRRAFFLCVFALAVRFFCIYSARTEASSGAVSDSTRLNLEMSLATRDSCTDQQVLAVFSQPQWHKQSLFYESVLGAADVSCKAWRLVAL